MRIGLWVVDVDNFVMVLSIDDGGGFVGVASALLNRDDVRSRSVSE